MNMELVGWILGVAFCAATIWWDRHTRARVTRTEKACRRIRRNVEKAIDDEAAGAALDRAIDAAIDAALEEEVLEGEERAIYGPHDPPPDYEAGGSARTGTWIVTRSYGSFLAYREAHRCRGRAVSEYRWVDDGIKLLDAWGTVHVLWRRVPNGAVIADRIDSGSLQLAFGTLPESS